MSRGFQGVFEGVSRGFSAGFQRREMSNNCAVWPINCQVSTVGRDISYVVTRGWLPCKYSHSNGKQCTWINIYQRRLDIPQSGDYRGETAAYRKNGKG